MKLKIIGTFAGEKSWSLWNDGELTFSNPLLEGRALRAIEKQRGDKLTYTSNKWEPEKNFHDAWQIIENVFDNVEKVQMDNEAMEYQDSWMQGELDADRDDDEQVQKAAKPIGTISDRKDGKYKKVGPKQWMRISDNGPTGQEDAPANKIKVSNTAEAVIKNGAQGYGDVMFVGKEIGEQVNKRLQSNFDKLENLQNEVKSLDEDFKVKINKYITGQGNPDREKYKQEAFAVRDIKQKKVDELLKMDEKISTENRGIIIDSIKQFRAIGNGKIEANFPKGSPNVDRIQKSIQELQEVIPEDFLNIVNEKVKTTSMTGKMNFLDVTERSSFEKDSDIINLDINSSDMRGDARHEFGHALENHIPMIKRMSSAFLERRTKGEESQQLNKLVPFSVYDDKEISKPDNFIDPYMGKIYKSGDTEVLTMGLQWLFDINMQKNMIKDKDYVNFLMGVLVSVKGDKAK